MLCSAIISLTLAASALANVFITNPVSNTTFTGGQPATVTWQDDGNSPSLAQFGNATFAIYVGNALEQVPLQTIGTYINVSAINSITFTPSLMIGPDSNEFFIRVTSITLKNPSSSQYYEEAFSAKFTLTGMSGSFNSTEQAAINGQSTAPIGVPTPAASGGGSTASGAAATTAAPASSSSGSGSGTSTNGAAKPVIATGFVGLVAVLLGASLL